jgi:serine/threonine protein kinase
MGNAPSNNSRSPISSPLSLSVAAAEATSSCEDASALVADYDTSTSHVVVTLSGGTISPAPPSAPLSSTSTSSATSGKFDSNYSLGISIQTLGSGSGSVPTTMDLGMFTIDALTSGNHQQTVGQTLGAALGGVGSAGGGIGYGSSNINIAPGDSLLNSLLKDMTASVLGGQLVAVGRLWPGSGRMMRSYRMRVRVPRMDSESSLDGEMNNPTNIISGSSDSPKSTAVSALPFTIDLVCKAFIVRSEHGEIHLRRVLSEGDAELKRLRSLLSDPAVHPHVFSYARWVIGQPLSPSSSYPSSLPAAAPASRSIYLLRQYAHASLSDRLISRPFLTSIEKTWIAYQLLNAVQSLHDAGVYHGHLTTENVLLTSWNWVLISDLGCQHHKPVVLPDDDPGMWIHWFEGRGGAGDDRENVGGIGHHRGGVNGEKKCCLAPERFYTPGCASGSSTSTAKTNDTDGQIGAGNKYDRGQVSIPTALTPEMDVFSLGCVLIELFLNGERALDLGDLMEYRRQGRGGGGPPTLPLSLKQKLDKIESSKMRAACRHMLSLEPSSRLKPSEYLERLSSTSSGSVKKKRSDAGRDEATIQHHHSRPPQSSTSFAPVPPCFKSTLYPFMIRLRTQIQSPDARIALVAIHYGQILKATVGVDDEWGIAYFSRVIGPTLRRNLGGVPPFTLRENYKNVSSEKKEGQTNIANISLDELLLETEEFLFQLDSGAFVSNLNDLSNYPSEPILPQTLSMSDHFPVSSFESKWPSQPTPSQTSIIILLQIVFSSVGHAQRPSSKFVALILSTSSSIF